MRPTTRSTVSQGGDSVAKKTSHKKQPDPTPLPADSSDDELEDENEMSQDEPSQEDSLEEAPLPADATRFPTKDLNLPALYKIKSHSKVKGPHGQLIMAVYDWRKPAMERLFRYAANLTAPTSEEDAIDRGRTSRSLLFSNHFTHLILIRFLPPDPFD
jgi:hypothetical protein